jgi:hypothetical protein
MKESQDNSRSAEETKAYLARINRTVTESKALLSQFELRMAETDRMLASQGLTREKVAAMQFTDEQIAAVNEELKRRGMAPMDFGSVRNKSSIEDRRLTGEGRAAEPNLDAGDSKEDLENRRRKFNVMMSNLKL